MAPILAHPFRILPNGRPATVEQHDTDGLATELAALILTRPGERPLAPTFGVTDPAFAELDFGEVAAGVALYGPPVELAALDVVDVDDPPGTYTIELAFS